MGPASLSLYCSGTEPWSHFWTYPPRACCTTMWPLSGGLVWRVISALCILELKMGNFLFPGLRQGCDEMFWVTCKMIIYHADVGVSLRVFVLLSVFYVDCLCIRFILLCQVVGYLKYSKMTGNSLTCYLALLIPPSPPPLLPPRPPLLTSLCTISCVSGSLHSWWLLLFCFRNKTRIALPYCSSTWRFLAVCRCFWHLSIWIL